MKIRFLHLILDEKFIDRLIYSFEQASLGEHKYLYYNQFFQPFHYISVQNQERIIVTSNLCKFRKIIKGGDYDVLVLHCLRSMDLRILADIPDRIKVWWCLWGYDVYSNSGIWYRTKNLIECNLLADNTEKFMRCLVWHPKYILKKLFYSAAFLLFSPERYFLSQHKFEKAIKRIDFCTPVCDFEYDLLRKNTFFRAEYLNFSYTLSGNVLQNTLKNLPEKRENVLIGNSAVATMNHIDALECVKDKLPDSAKVIVPLSYGDQMYANAIEKYGRNIFGGKVLALRNFMPVDEYVALVGSCNSAVFFTFRQQALGNIRMMLYLGCKVFLPEDSFLYNYFKSKKIIVFSTNEITQESLKSELTEKEKESNRINISEDVLSQNGIEKIKKLYNFFAER